MSKVQNSSSAAAPGERVTSVMCGRADVFRSTIVCLSSNNNGRGIGHRGSAHLRISGSLKRSLKCGTGSEPARLGLTDFKICAPRERRRQGSVYDRPQASEQSRPRIGRADFGPEPWDAQHRCSIAVNMVLRRMRYKIRMSDALLIRVQGKHTYDSCTLCTHLARHSTNGGEGLYAY